MHSHTVIFSDWVDGMYINVQAVYYKTNYSVASTLHWKSKMCMNY